MENIIDKKINTDIEQIKLALISATFGTIGFVSHFIPLSSSAISF